MAAERAAGLEAQLQEAEDAGLRAEIARRLAAQRRLRAVERVTLATQAQRRADENFSQGPGAGAAKPAPRYRSMRYAAAAAASLVVGSAVAVLAPHAPTRDGSENFPAPSAFVHGSPDDGLKLALSYTMREPAKP